MTHDHRLLAEPQRFGAAGVILAFDERSINRRFAASRTRPAAYMGEGADPATRLGYRRDGRVAIVRIEGPLDQRASVDFFGFWDGYDAITARICAALADPQVDVVLVVVDSPGGLVAGCFEAAAMLRMAIDASGKKVVVYGDEMICSAAYGVACVADTIITPKSGMIGSVGVLIMLTNFSAALEKEGVQVVALASGSRKTDGSSKLPLNPDAIVRLQGEVDTLAGQFISLVAEERGLSPEAVRALEAGTFIGQAAVDAGLADRVGSFAEALAHAQSLTTQTPAGALPAPTSGATMKSVLAHLGLNEQAGEADVLAAVSARTAPIADLCAITDKTNPAEAVGVVRGWSQTAAAYDTLVKEREADKKAARAAAVDGIFAMALDTGRLNAAQIAAKKKSIEAGVLSLDTDEKVAAFKAEIEASPVVLPGKDPKEPAKPPAEGAIGGKRWEDMTPDQKAVLARENPEAYVALRDDYRERNPKGRTAR
jgi:signal peptide peptidase SppA